MEDSRAFLGRGFAFPPEVDPVTGKFRMAEGEEDIRRHLYYSDDQTQGEGHAAGLWM